MLKQKVKGGKFNKSQALVIVFIHIYIYAW